MKSLQDLYKEIIANEELKKAFMEAAKAGKVLEFIKAHGCETTDEELKAFLLRQSGELSDAELDNAAGGGCNDKTVDEAYASAFSLGIACAIVALNSCLEGYVGQGNPEEGRLCNPY